MLKAIPPSKIIYDSLHKTSLGANLKTRKKKEEEESKYSQGQFVQMMKKNDISAAEARDIFTKLDKNSDGTVNAKEFQTSINVVKVAHQDKVQGTDQQTQKEEKLKDLGQSRKIDTFG